MFYAKTVNRFRSPLYILFQELASIQQAILRRLQNDDISVAQAALSLDGLTRVISVPDLLEVLCDFHN